MFETQGSKTQYRRMKLHCHNLDFSWPLPPVGPIKGQHTSHPLGMQPLERQTMPRNFFVGLSKLSYG